MKIALIGAGGALLLWGLVAATRSDFALGRNMEILLNVFRTIDLLYVDEVDPDALVAAAAEGMTAELDPYTEFLPEEDMSDFETLTTGKYGGVGALIRQSGDYVVVAQPYRGFPADRAGLAVGDTILRIDRHDARGMTTAEVSDALRGDPGTSVELLIGKFYSAQHKALKIKRERIAISGISYAGHVAPGIGYIRHDDFTEDCAADFRKALMELQKDSLHGLVVDLRNNGGGILQEAVKIVSLFVPKGTEVVSMRGRSEETKATFLTESEPIALDLPVVLLVNGASASASEIVAGAMQDLDRAVLVGRRTFGKGLVQTPRPVGYNAYLKLTTAKYYTPAGRSVQDLGGLTPEVELEADYPGRFVAEIYGRGYIEQFVDAYLLRNPALQVPPMSFELPREAYALFIDFMRDKPLDYRSEIRHHLDALRQAAERERYLERIETELEAIEADLNGDPQAELERLRADLERLIVDEIILRRHYIDGVIRHNLPDDPWVIRAIEILDLCDPI